MVVGHRPETMRHLLARIDEAAAAGEIPASADRGALARFVQAIQAGMSILAGDGASGPELQAVADIAMQGWDAGSASGGTSPD